MFVHEIDEDISLKLIEPRDREKIFELVNNSRDYLREWLPSLDNTTKLEDTKEFIKIYLKGFAENISMNAVILFNGKIVGVSGYNEINWSNKTAYIGYWLGKEFQGNGIMTKVLRH